MGSLSEVWTTAMVSGPAGRLSEFTCLFLWLAWPDLHSRYLPEVGVGAWQRGQAVRQEGVAADWGFGNPSEGVVTGQVDCLSVLTGVACT